MGRTRCSHLRRVVDDRQDHHVTALDGRGRRGSRPLWHSFLGFRGQQQSDGQALPTNHETVPASSQAEITQGALYRIPPRSCSATAGPRMNAVDIQYQPADSTIPRYC